MVYDHFNKKKPVQSFDANAWRDSQVSAQRNGSERTNTILIGLIGVMLLVSGGLYYHTNIKPNQKAKQALRMADAQNPGAMLEQQQSEAEQRLAVLAAQPISAEAQKYNAIKAEIQKYTETSNTLRSCGTQVATVASYYRKTNYPKYQKLTEMARASRKAGVGLAIPSSMAKSQAALSKIETKGDAIKFMASGGAKRHMEASMETFAALDSMMSEMDAAEKRKRELSAKARDRNFCLQLKTKAQTGQLNIKMP